MTLIITLCLDIPYMVLGVLCIDYILTAVRVPVNLLACLNFKPTIEHVYGITDMIVPVPYEYSGTTGTVATLQ